MSARKLSSDLRSPAMPKEIAHWTLTTLRKKLSKIGAKLVSGGGYVQFRMAEVAISWRMFAQIFKRINRLRDRYGHNSHDSR